MTPTLFEINIAMIMVAASVAMVVWFQGYLATASASRMARMMARIGMDPAIATGGRPQSAAILKQMRQRCRRCPSEDLCDRWVAGTVKGGNSFCPNVRAFGLFAKTAR
ncbi:MAG: DUF6455 family protein [Hyphomicrobiales bacterium]|nr:DUF6455 family protein [Hyphomicrobiales bacterium]